VPVEGDVPYQKNNIQIDTVTDFDAERVCQEQELSHSIERNEPVFVPYSVASDHLVEPWIAIPSPTYILIISRGLYPMNRGALGTLLAGP
jgi:hypothetical protein